MTTTKKNGKKANVGVLYIVYDLKLSISLKVFENIWLVWHKINTFTQMIPPSLNVSESVAKWGCVCVCVWFVQKKGMSVYIWNLKMHKSNLLIAVEFNAVRLLLLYGK